MSSCKKCGMKHLKFKNGRVKKSCPKGGSLLTTALTTRPKVVKEMVANYGSQKIVAIKICRQPIISAFNWIYEKVAPSQVKAVREKYGYDKFFHLYMILYLEDGTAIRYEKNERVSAKPNYVETDEPKDCVAKTPVSKSITVSQLVDDYENVGSWRYDVENANCQYFVRDNSHILGITQYDTFIKQKLEGVLPKWSKWLARLATDTSALIDYGIKGGMIIRPPMRIRPPISIKPIPRPIYIK
jgi:hypothetical protein